MRFIDDLPGSAGAAGAAPQPHIAVIGSGAAGLAAAWRLDGHAHVTLFEADHRLGGHVNTVTVDDPLGPLPVDTGFIVFNSHNYPTLTSAFDILEVDSRATDMSFAVSLGEDVGLEYASNGPKRMFAGGRNSLRPNFWRMLADIPRFYRNAKLHKDDPAYFDMPLDDYLIRHGYSQVFRDWHLLPMAAAIWSAPVGRIAQFPAASLFRFFDNHCLLELRNRPKWRTVVGGSETYVQKLLAHFSGEIRMGTPVQSVRRTAQGVEVMAAGAPADVFDGVVMACHADQSLRLLQTPTRQETSLLGAFGYEKNLAVLHRDAAQMPRREDLWSAWNYLAHSGSDDDGLAVTYWMNHLQGLKATRDYFVTLNPLTTPRDILREMTYHHPVFDRAALHAQARLPALQGQDGLFYAGSYFGYGFHEDAFASGLQAAEAVKAQIQCGGLMAPASVQRAATLQKSAAA